MVLCAYTKSGHSVNLQSVGQKIVQNCFLCFNCLRLTLSSPASNVIFIASHKMEQHRSSLSFANFQEHNFDSGAVNFNGCFSIPTPKTRKLRSDRFDVSVSVAAWVYSFARCEYGSTAGVNLFWTPYTKEYLHEQYALHHCQTSQSRHQSVSTDRTEQKARACSCVQVFAYHFPAPKKHTLTSKKANIIIPTAFVGKCSYMIGLIRKVLPQCTVEQVAAALKSKQHSFLNNCRPAAFSLLPLSLSFTPAPLCALSCRQPCRHKQ